MIKFHRVTLDFVPEQTVRLPQWRTNMALQLEDCQPTFWCAYNDVNIQWVNATIRCYSKVNNNMDIANDNIGWYMGTVQLYGVTGHFFCSDEQVVRDIPADPIPDVQYASLEVPTMQYAVEYAANPVNSVSWTVDPPTPAMRPRRPRSTRTT